MGIASEARLAILAFLVPLLLAVAAGAVSVVFGRPALPSLTPDAALSAPAPAEDREAAGAGLRMETA